MLALFSHVTLTTISCTNLEEVNAACWQMQQCKGNVHMHFNLKVMTQICSYLRPIKTADHGRGKGEVFTIAIIHNLNVGHILAPIGCLRKHLDLQL